MNGRGWIFALGFPSLGIAIAGGGRDAGDRKLPPVPVTVPSSAKAQVTVEGARLTPLRDVEPREIEWAALLREQYAGVEMSAPPESATLPGERGEVVNLYALAKRAVASESFGRSLREGKLASDLPEALREFAAVLVDDARLRSDAWSPDDWTPNEPESDGIHLLSDPWIASGLPHYQGAVFLRGTLEEIRGAQHDFARQLSDVGQDYLQLWPVEGEHFRGTGPEGAEFGSRGVLAIRRIEMGYKIAYHLRVLEHWIGDVLVDDYYATGDRVRGYECLQWMRGRNVYLPVRLGDETVGYVIASALGFEAVIEATFLRIRFRDDAEDHYESLRTLLGNWKRRVES